MNIPRKYYLWLLLGVVILIIVEYNKPQKIDWSRTYSSYDNIPFGTKVLFDLIPGIFPEKSVKRINQTIYDFTNENIYDDYTLIFIAENVSFSQLSCEKLLDYVKKGNEVLISAKNISKTLTDSLDIELEKTRLKFIDKSVKLKFNNKLALIDTISKIPTIDFQTSIKSLKDSKYEINVLDSSNSSINFAKIDYGEGSFFIHTEPLIFTNYYLLKGYSKDYCEEVLRQLNVKNIVWSDYPNNGLRMSLNPLRYILSSDSYRYGYYVLVVLIILYIGFAGRRRQRPIPVIEPHINSSVDFIYTISNLYLSNKNNKKIAQHRINYFKNYLRTNFFINWKLSEDEIIQVLGKKTGKGNERVGYILKYIKQIESTKNISQQELFKLNKEIDYFILK
jgi:hypothetical protein